MAILDHVATWEAWFYSHVTPVVDPAWLELSITVEDRLAALRATCDAEEGLRRDRWEVFAPQPIKSAGRVRAKLLADGGGGDDDLAERVLALGDLARFRVVATLKRDVKRCRRELVSEDGTRFLDRYQVRSFKDFVRDETLRRPLAGHRALQLVVEVPTETRPVCVEVQIMTLLQHAWDRRNHAMYEWLREKEGHGLDEVTELRVDDHAVAESLHALDALADHNFETFLQLRSRS